MGRASAAPALVVASVLVVVLLPDAAFAQCAMCRRALQSPEGQQMVAAFQSGILILLAAPAVVFAAVATIAVRMARRRDRA
jgi:hypothetical protein